MVTALLPAEDRSNFGTSVRMHSELRWQRPPGILVVDDEESIRTLLSVVLERAGFTVWSAADGRAAVELYRQLADSIAVVLLDVRMPGLDGPQTLAALQTIRSGVCACFMSGHTGEYAERELLERGAACLFPKPFRLDEIRKLVHRLANYEVRQSA